MALSTSSDKFHDKMKKFIIDNFVQPCKLGYEDFPIELNTNDFDTVAYAILYIFRDEKIKNNKNFNGTNEEKIFEDWCQGLPSVLSTDTWYLHSCIDIYKDLLEISDKQIKQYDFLYTEEYCEKKITHYVYNELARYEYKVFDEF